MPPTFSPQRLHLRTTFFHLNFHTMSRTKTAMVHKTRRGANGEPFRTSVSPKAVPHFVGQGWEQEAVAPVEAKGKGSKKGDKKPASAEQGESGEEAVAE